MSTQEANRPVHTIRHGRIKATIWCNQTQKGPMYNVTFSRSYQDDEQNWHDTQSFGVGDLMTVAKASSDAHTWISGEQAKNENNGDHGSNGSGPRKDERSNPKGKAPQRPTAAAR
jgi:hypothetical protein